MALFDNSALISGSYAVLGRGHAERLVPMIAQLPGKGHAERILVSLGPGSFTGVRIGIAAAQGLGLAWNAPVLGYPTLALVAAMARKAYPGEAVKVCMTGGHGEWFVQEFSGQGLPVAALSSLAPDIARAATGPQQIAAGSKAAELQQHRCGGVALDILPDAREAMALPEALLTSTLAPIYGRAPDARAPKGQSHGVQSPDTKPAQPKSGGAS